MKESNTARRDRNRQRGFSLIELLVVLGIVALLSAISIASVKDTLHRARAARTASDLVIVSNLIEQYILDHGAMPEADGLRPVSEIESLLVPAYTRALPKVDGWGHEMHYEQLLVSGKNDNVHGGAGGQEMWVICHVTGSGEVTITVALPSVLNAHLHHGDSVGECGGSNEEEDPDETLPGYRVYSFGRDGLPDGDTVTGLYYGSSSDIVVENGMLIQWSY